MNSNSSSVYDSDWYDQTNIYYNEKWIGLNNTISKQINSLTLVPYIYSNWNYNRRMIGLLVLISSTIE